jgi:hypothetical protein
MMVVGLITGQFGSMLPQSQRQPSASKNCEAQAESVRDHQTEAVGNDIPLHVSSTAISENISGLAQDFKQDFLSLLESEVEIGRIPRVNIRESLERKRLDEFSITILGGSMKYSENKK